MPAQVIYSKVQQETNRSSFIIRTIRSIEAKTASFVLLFYECDYFNSDKLIICSFISIEYLVFIAYCFSQQSIQDWRTNPWTIQCAKILQFFDPAPYFTDHFSYNKYLFVLGCLMAAFVTTLVFIIQATRLRGKSGVAISVLNTFVRIVTPVLFVSLQSLFLRVLLIVVS